PQPGRVVGVALGQRGDHRQRAAVGRDRARRIAERALEIAERQLDLEQLVLELDAVALGLEQPRAQLVRGAVLVERARRIAADLQRRADLVVAGRQREHGVLRAAAGGGGGALAL